MPVDNGIVPRRAVVREKCVIECGGVTPENPGAKKHAAVGPTKIHVDGCGSLKPSGFSRFKKYAVFSWMSGSSDGIACVVELPTDGIGKVEANICLKFLGRVPALLCSISVFYTAFLIPGPIHLILRIP